MALLVLAGIDARRDFAEVDTTDGLGTTEEQTVVQREVVAAEGIQRLAGKIKVFMFALVIGQLSMVALAVGGLQSTLQGGM